MQMKLPCALGVALLVLPLFAGDRIDRRRDFRREVSARPELADKYLDDEDSEIRRYSLYMLIKREGLKALPRISKAMDDGDDFIRILAARALFSMKDEDEGAMKTLVDKGSGDENPVVHDLAIQASWPFHREVRLLRDDPTWDHEIQVAKSITLPEKGWRFKLDPTGDRHFDGWYKPDFDRSGWNTIDIGYWEDQGAAGYDGVAWYAVEFDAPANEGYNAVELSFGSVDESAWIWLNGIYLGKHDLGPGGWNVPFRIDGTKELKWGARNSLVVRVLDRSQGGGIWKPVLLDLLK